MNNSSSAMMPAMVMELCLIYIYIYFDYRVNGMRRVGGFSVVSIGAARGAGRRIRGVVSEVFPSQNL